MSAARRSTACGLVSAAAFNTYNEGVDSTPSPCDDDESPGLHFIGVSCIVLPVKAYILLLLLQQYQVPCHLTVANGNLQRILIFSDEVASSAVAAAAATAAASATAVGGLCKCTMFPVCRIKRLVRMYINPALQPSTSAFRADAVFYFDRCRTMSDVLDRRRHALSLFPV